MATQYQTAYGTARSAGSAPAVERQFKLTERQIAEAHNIVSSGATSFQTTHSTILAESGNQRQVDYIANERQIAEGRN